MTFKSIQRQVACHAPRGHLNPRAHQVSAVTATQARPRWTACPDTAFPHVFVRGAKTKTIVQRGSLPQGVLPALPADASQTVPAKTYPTVLQQHLNNMRKFKDCIILTRVGDFYELYFDQVEQYAPLVSLKKAKRATALGDVPMAGFQANSLERYLKMFVQDHGKQVAISEQIRLPDGGKPGNGPAYDRKVTRVITAGTLVDENFVDPHENNYLLAVHLPGSMTMTDVNFADDEAFARYKQSTRVGLSWVDLSSGEFFTQASDLASLPSLVARIGPREVVLDSSMEALGQTQLQRFLGDGGHTLHFYAVTSLARSVAAWTPMLERAVPEKEHDAFVDFEIAAGSLVLDYVRDKLQDMSIQLQPPVRRSDDEYMAIDKQSLRGLEIRSTLRDGTFQGSLLHAVRNTVTKSGARLLGQRLVSPSMSLSVINNRLDLLEEMLHHNALREDVIALLRRTADTRRLLQRFSIGKGDADDLLSLAKTIDVMGLVVEVLHEHVIGQQDHESEESDSQKVHRSLGFLWEILSRIDLEGPAKVAKSIEEAIDEDSLIRQHTADAEEQEAAEEMTDEVVTADATGEKGPKLAGRASRARTAGSADVGPVEIWIMRRDASNTLLRAHADLDTLMQLKQDLAISLRKDLGAESLSLKWSAQLGHFCHVKGRDAKGSIAALQGARSIGSTKSTRSFYLLEWSQLGGRIDDSKLRIRTEEERVFSKLRAHVIENLMKLRRNASVLDELDVACSSATIAKARNLVRPVLHSGASHNIINGRHPTVDIGLRESGRLFIPNNCSVGLDNKESVYLITGPNMAGKSTYLRQNALITILAQTGCFVPADHAEIGLVDKIFSRVGSADNLYQDQSTFMVEMLETASILKSATPRSFVIMDEVGRGTTPEDGIAVGYACLHHLHNVNRCRTLFATHFHALADMTRDFEGLGCYCTDVEEDGDGSWAYVHRLKKGVNRKSHALKVARLAGMPEEAVRVAAEVLDSSARRQMCPK